MSARFVAGRLGGLVATLLVASFVIFGALYAAPGSPITFLTHGRSMTPEAIAALNAQYHLDEPPLAQYWRWLTGVVRGEFGTSILYQDSVGSLLAGRAMNTVALVLFSAVLIIVAGLVIGVLAGLRPGIVANSLMALSTASMAVPAFVAAVVLTLVFAVDLGWFPVFGSGSGLADRIWHLALPAVALALASVAFVARLTQTAVRQELAADHVQTAVSRGLPYRFIVRRHVLRNATIPVLTVTGLTVAGLIASSVVVEQAFQLNGLGSYLVSSVQQKDFPVVQAICLVYVAAFIVLNTLIDLAYSLLDPRIALGRRPS
ncbi:ABC transporter permease [Nonomuraea sediminis]|uniref:ABC transporter permease n=1 Tax=Nonomuraea sediminis TaxID=2835864 RepID=UPI001BDD7F49|nr:ABC transporter permease [Nonomuraea sediminis]